MKKVEGKRFKGKGCREKVGGWDLSDYLRLISFGTYSLVFGSSFQLPTTASASCETPQSHAMQL